MVEYKSQLFVRALIGIIGLLFVLNVLGFLASGSLLALPSILFLGVVLFGLLKKKLWIKTAVRVWAGFVVFSGAYPLFLAAPMMTTMEFVISVIKCVVGLAIFFLSDRYIDVDEFADIDWRKSKEKSQAHT